MSPATRQIAVGGTSATTSVSTTVTIAKSMMPEIHPRWAPANTVIF